MPLFAGFFQIDNHVHMPHGERLLLCLTVQVLDNNSTKFKDSSNMKELSKNVKPVLLGFRPTFVCVEFLTLTSGSSRLRLTFWDLVWDPFGLFHLF